MSMHAKNKKQKQQPPTQLLRKYFKQKRNIRFCECQVIGYSRSILPRFVLEKQGGAIKDDHPANSTKGTGSPPGM